MAKPVYYLWIDKDTNMDELEIKKQKYINAGFDIAVFNNSKADGDLKDIFINIIKNHMN